MNTFGTLTVIVFFIFSYLSIKFKIAQMPTNANWVNFYGVGELFLFLTGNTVEMSFHNSFTISLNFFLSAKNSLVYP